MSYNQRVRPSTQAIFRSLACAALVALTVLVYVKLLHVNPTTVALTFLLAVLAVAASWGLRYAIPMSIAAALCFNFFFLPPVGTLTIADTQNWVALFAFLFTSIVASNLSERARRQTWEAHQRRQEVERLYTFSQQLLVAENVVALLQTIPHFLAETFGAVEAAIYLSNNDRIYRSNPDRRSVEAERLKEAAARGDLFFDQARTLIVAPLRMGVRTVGAFGLFGEIPSRATMEAVGSLIATAVERANAVERLTHTEAA